LLRAGRGGDPPNDIDSHSSSSNTVLEEEEERNLVKDCERHAQLDHIDQVGGRLPYPGKTADDLHKAYKDGSLFGLEVSSPLH